MSELVFQLITLLIVVREYMTSLHISPCIGHLTEQQAHSPKKMIITRLMAQSFCRGVIKKVQTLPKFMQPEQLLDIFQSTWK